MNINSLAKCDSDHWTLHGGSHFDLVMLKPMTILAEEEHTDVGSQVNPARGLQTSRKGIQGAKSIKIAYHFAKFSPIIRY